MTSRVNSGYNEIRLDRLRTANNRFMRGIIPFGGHAYLDAVQAQAVGNCLQTANGLLPQVLLKPPELFVASRC